MTFASETVRLLFHQLPTTTQLNYERLEHRLADDGQSISIESINRYERILEVVVRITEDLDFAPLVHSEHST
jgi:hypothetical protein